MSLRRVSLQPFKRMFYEYNVERCFERWFRRSQEGSGVILLYVGWSVDISELRITGVGFFAFADGHLTIFYMEHAFVVIATSTERLLCQVLGFK